MPVITEKELRAAMRDPRYTQSGHPESRAFRAWVGEGWRQLVAANEAGRGDGRRSQVRVRPTSASATAMPNRSAATPSPAPPAGARRPMPPAPPTIPNPPPRQRPPTATSRKSGW